MSTRRALSVLALVTTTACGATPNVSAPDSAHVAQTAADPRSEDPTAGQPAPVEAKPAPAATATAKKPEREADEEPATRGAPVREARIIGARHVLVQWYGCDRAGPSVLRNREQAEALIQEVQRKVQAGQDLGRLAIEYSDEPNAGSRGGSLGRFQRGQMIPAFEAVAFKLKVGEISGIVETPFGFHIIQRTE